jgi:hypothetical protein
MATVFFKRLFLLNIKETICRFPLSVLCSVVFTFLCAVKINKIYIMIEPEIWFYILLLCGFFSYLALRLFSENHSISKKLYPIIIFGLTAFLVYSCWTQNYINLSLLLFGILPLLFVSPYIFNDMGEVACCNFNAELVRCIVFSALATIILCAGLSLAFASIEYLFDLRINHLIYANIWLIGVVLFAPFYALSGVPKDFQLQEKEYQKGIAFIFSYILAPLIIGYLGILYCYIIKILIEWNLPKGNVAYMVLAFGIIGIFTHAFSYPLRGTGTKLLKIVYRYFYYALLAPVVLLFVGIGVRINEYGFTEERYLVVLFAIWFLLSAAYFILKKDPTFKNIILAISLMLIFSSFGIWGAVQVSGFSQVARLKTLLEKNNILINGTIHKISNEIDFEDNENISSIIQYLAGSGKQLLIKSWFPSDSYINRTNDKRLIASRIMEDMGITYLSKWQTSIQQSGSFHYYAKESVVNIEGFDYYSGVVSMPLNLSGWSKVIEIPNTKNSKLELYVVREGVMGVRSHDKNVSLEFDLTETVKNLIKDGIKTGSIGSEGDLLIKTQEKSGINVRLYLKSIGGRTEDGEPVITNIAFDLAVKYK